MKRAGQVESGIGKGGGRGRGERCGKSVECREWLEVFSFLFIIRKAPHP
jgi:hypothetical protein